MYKDIPGIHEKQSFTVGEVARLFDMTVQGIHRWIELDKLRSYYRTSKRGNYRIPRREVVRLLKLLERPVPGLWEGPSREAKRILVIDDYAPIRKLIEEGFRDRRLGFSVEVAASLQEGLLKIGSSEPHVVVVDYLPDADGRSSEGMRAFLRSAKSEFGRIKFIGMVPTRALGVKLLRAGVDGILQKPFTLEELKNLLFLHAFGERRVRERRSPLQGLVADVSAN